MNYLKATLQVSFGFALVFVCLFQECRAYMVHTGEQLGETTSAYDVQNRYCHSKPAKRQYALFQQ